jgi:hypothetical protein
MRAGEKLLRDLGITLSSQAVTREALIRELRESGSSASGTTIAPDGSIHMHASLTVYSEEFSVFLGHQNIILMADLANWFDCPDNWTYRTKTQGTDTIVGIFVNIIGATTPEQIRTAIPSDLVGIGLSSRIIYVFEEKEGALCVAPFITPAKRALYDKLLADLTQIHLISGEYRMSNDYLARYSEWYLGAGQVLPFNDNHFMGYFKRRSVHLRKLCLIMSASRGDDMILTAADFDRALDLLNRTEQKMPMTFMGFGRSPHSNLTIQCLHYIQDMKRPVRRSELLQAFYRDMDLKASEGVLSTLRGMGLIQIKALENGDCELLACTRTKGDISELLLRGGF